MIVITTLKSLNATDSVSYFTLQTSVGAHWTNFPDYTLYQNCLPNYLLRCKSSSKDGWSTTVRGTLGRERFGFGTRERTLYACSTSCVRSDWPTWVFGAVVSLHPGWGTLSLRHTRKGYKKGYYQSLSKLQQWSALSLIEQVITTVLKVVLQMRK